MMVYAFPGQGSQKKGMGGMLFDEFKELTEQAELILGESVAKLCLEDPNSNLHKTQYTQPALYVVNALYYLKKIRETGKKPDYVLGHSLGEYNALFAAGAFDFETGLKLVIARGQLMGNAKNGSMAAIIGLEKEQIANRLKQNDLNGIDIANYNSKFQFVISGLHDEMKAAKSIFEEMKDVQMFIPLNTSGAFHSRYMEQARQKFESYLDGFTFSKIEIPVIANVHAVPYQQADIKQNLVQQITHPVKWADSIRYLLGLGDMEFAELGPGRVLSGLIRRIKTELESLTG